MNDVTYCRTYLVSANQSQPHSVKTKRTAMIAVLSIIYAVNKLAVTFYYFYSTRFLGVCRLLFQYYTSNRKRISGYLYIIQEHYLKEYKKMPYIGNYTLYTSYTLHILLVNIFRLHWCYLESIVMSETKNSEIINFINNVSSTEKISQ